MDTRIEIIDGQEVEIQICPPGPEPRKLSVKGKATKAQRHKKLRRLGKWKDQMREKYKAKN